MVSISKLKKNEVEYFVPLLNQMMQFHATFDELYAVHNDLDLIGAFCSSIVKSRDASIFVAKEGNNILGYIMVRQISRPPIFKLAEKLVIEGIYVIPDQRDKQIGKKLIDYILNQFSHISVIELDVATQNSVANAFWRKQEFYQVSNRLLKQIK